MSPIYPPKKKKKTTTEIVTLADETTRSLAMVESLAQYSESNGLSDSFKYSESRKGRPLFLLLTKGK